MKKVYMVCYSAIDGNGVEFLTEVIFTRKSAAESHIKLNNRHSCNTVWFIKEVGCGKSTVFMYLKEENKFLYKNETYKQKRRRKSKHVIGWKKQKREQTSAKS